MTRLELFGLLAGYTVIGTAIAVVVLVVIWGGRRNGR